MGVTSRREGRGKGMQGEVARKSTRKRPKFSRRGRGRSEEAVPPSSTQAAATLQHSPTPTRLDAFSSTLRGGSAHCSHHPRSNDTCGSSCTPEQHVPRSTSSTSAACPGRVIGKARIEQVGPVGVQQHPRVYHSPAAIRLILLGRPALARRVQCSSPLGLSHHPPGPQWQLRSGFP